MDTRTGGGGPDGGREASGRRDLERLRAITLLFDQAFLVPGTKWRFGLDALFGLVPGLGDIAGALVAVFALRVARRLNAPPAIQLHLLSNIALDASVGMVPILGDLFDFAFKAQTRNLALLDAWMATPHKTARRSHRGLLLIPIAIVIVFATLTALGIWMLVILVHWLGSLFTSL
ncbi:MAG TPA: DUF4112 domain-containing protein [Steroidobacteraceae bacterium]|nr:DUF4112 domain-containing protein [Steroidobacteraceae bacterium]